MIGDIVKNPRGNSPFQTLRNIEVAYGKLAPVKGVMNIAVTGKEREKELENMAKSIYETMSPKQWIAENKMMSVLDLEFCEFIELENGEVHELEGLAKIEHEEYIKLKRTNIYNTRVKQGRVSGLSKNEFYKMWFPIVEINYIRAIKDLDRINTKILKGKYDAFILKTIETTGRATKTKIKSLYHRNIATVTKRIENNIYKAFDILVKKGAIIENIKPTYTDYLLAENCFLSNSDKWVIKTNP